MPQEKPLFIDFSIASTYNCCNEKARLAYQLHLAPKVIERPLAYGHAIHSGIHAAYLAQAAGLSFEAKCDAAVTAFLEDVKRQGADLPISIEDTEPRSLERGENIIRAYLTRWKDEQLVPLKGANGEPYVEIGFSVYLFDFKGVPVFVVGRIDRIMESLIDGSLHVTDTKTSTGSTWNIQQSVRPNHQATIYFSSAQELLGREITSVVFDAIYISDRQPNTKKGGWFQFGVDIDKDFGRFPTMRTEVDIEEAMLDLKETAERYFQGIEDIASGKRKRWNRNAPAACTMYGGCKFKEVCSTNCNPQIIEANFDVRPWEPFPGLVKENGQ